MANKNTIKKDDVLTVKDVKSGHSQKGDWCFVKFQNNDKLTVWADNKDFSAEVGDTVKILDIKSISISVKKVGETFYSNTNVYALLKKESDNSSAFDDAPNDIFGNDEDFI